MSALEQDDMVVEGAVTDAATAAAYPIVGAVRVWNGGTADWYSDSWTTTTTGVTNSYPLPGDLATVASGTALLEGSEAKVAGTFDANTVTLGSGTTSTATLELDSAVTGITFDITAAGDAAILATGVSDVEGALTAGVAGATLTLGSAAGGDLVFTHGASFAFSGAQTVDFTGTTTLEAGAGFDAPASVTLNNNGVINAIGVTVTTEGALQGAGTVNLAFGAVFDAEGAVAAGQTFAFSDVGNELEFGAPSSFAGAVTGFAPGDLIDFQTIAATGASYDASAHQLTLTNGAATVATLDNISAQSGSLAAVSDGSNGTIIAYAGTPNREHYLITAGDQALGADVVRATVDAPGTNTLLTGAGVKIGIISDSFNVEGDANANAAAGYLPANADGTSAVIVLKEGAAGSDDEGQEMADVVHQVAPGAQLYFASGGASQTSFADSIQQLKQAGCTIIVDDLTEGDGATDQISGTVANGAVNAVADNVSYFTSGGNYGHAFYQGAFTPSMVTLPNGVTENANIFGNGSPYEPLTINAGVSANVNLQWAAPYESASNQGVTVPLSMDLFNSSGQLVATSMQDVDTNTPIADISLNVTPMTTQTFELVVFSDTSTPPPSFSFILSGGGAKGTGPGGTIDDPAAGSGSGDERAQQLIPQVNSIGAIYYGQSAAFGQQPSTNESFSNYGPGDLLYDSDGVALAAPQSAGKIDFSAPDGVSTVVTSPAAFYGTSSATPEAGAVAALMLQADSYLNPAQVSYLLAGSAVAFGDPLQSGAGLIQAGPAVQGAILAATTPIWTAQDHTLSWNDAQNWSDQVVPGASDTVQLTNGVGALTGAYTVDYALAQSTVAALNIDGGGTAQPTLIIADGDTLMVTGAVTLAEGATLIVMGALNAAQLSLDAVSALAFHAAGDQAFAAVVSGAGAVQQAGTGTLTLSGASTYSGGTVIEAGALALDQATTGSFGAIASGAAGGGAISFTAGDETLVANAVALNPATGGSGSELLYPIMGFTDGDVIDLGGVTGAMSTNYNGSALDLLGGTTQLAELHIGAGYGADTFTLTSDGSGGTDVSLASPIMITGALAGQPVTDSATLHPFASVTVSDANMGATSETAALTVTSAADGTATDANGVLTGAGLTETSPGVYTLSADNAADLNRALQALVFTPTVHQVTPGQYVATAIALQVSDGAAGGSGDSGVSVIATASERAPTTTDQTATVTERTFYTGDAVSSDTIPDAEGSLTVTSASNPYTDGGAAQAVTTAGLLLQGSYGELSVAPDGEYSYDANAEGETVGVSYPADTFTVTLSDGYGSTVSQTLSFTSVGSPTGDYHNNIIVGGSGAPETIEGLGGADLLETGSAADTFLYAAAIDSPYSASAISYDTIEGFRSGTDKIDLHMADGGAVELVRDDSGASPQTFVYFDPDGNGGYQGVIDVYGIVQPGDLITTANPVYAYGDAAVGQVLDGSLGDAFLVAGSGATTLLAGPSDTLYAGSGADDFMIGSLSASLSSAYDVVAGFKSGVDKLDISAVDGGHVLLQAFDGDTFVYFDTNSSGGYQGVVEVTSLIAASDLMLSSAAQANGIQIVGDTHEAATATETLAGGPETDYIYAGAGQDTLYGKGGADFLVGGAGADTFAYHAISDSTPSAQDIIDNFDPAKGDIIDLSVLDQNSGVTGTFVIAFDGHAGEYELVQPTASSSYWHVLGDLTGAGSADFEIAFNVTGATTDYQSIQAHIHL